MSSAYGNVLQLSSPRCPPPQAQHTHDAITEAAQLMKEAVDDIMVTLNEAASEVGLVGGMVDAIAEAMSKVGLGPQMLSCTPWPHFLQGSPLTRSQGLFSKELSEEPSDPGCH